MFATNFTRARGKVEVLRKLIDREDSKTTMKYAPVDDALKRAAIQFEIAPDQQGFTSMGGDRIVTVRNNTLLASRNTGI